VRRIRGKNRQLASAFAALLIPASLMAYVLGFWRLASDIGLTAAFAIPGLFSHWQIWIGIALALSLTSSMLSRYGRGGEFEVPRVLAPFPKSAGAPAPRNPAQEPKIQPISRAR